MTKKNKTTPLVALKKIAELERANRMGRDAIARRSVPTTPPAPRARKRVDTQTKRARAQTRQATMEAKAKLRKRGVPATTAEADEFIRRSRAAKKGWAKIPPAERSEIARRGWDTRYAEHGSSREARHRRKRLEKEGRQTREQLYGNPRSGPRSTRFGDPQLPGWEFLRDR